MRRWPIRGGDGGNGGAVLLNARGGRISDGELSVWPCAGISDSSTQVSTTELLLSPTRQFLLKKFIGVEDASQSKDQLVR